MNNEKQVILLLIKYQQTCQEVIKRITTGNAFFRLLTSKLQPLIFLCSWTSQLLGLIQIKECVSMVQVSKLYALQINKVEVNHSCYEYYVYKSNSLGILVLSHNN